MRCKIDRLRGCAWLGAMDTLWFGLEYGVGYLLDGVSAITLSSTLIE